MSRIQELLKKKPVRMGLMGVTFITVLAVAQTALNWNEEAPVAKKVRRDLVESNVFDTGALEKVDTDMAQATYDQQKKELMNIKRDTQRMSEGQKKDLDKVLQKMTELQRQVADLAVLAAERILGHELTNPIEQKRMVNEFLASKLQ